MTDFTATNIKTGETVSVIAANVDQALTKIASERRAQINAKLAGAKAVNTIRCAPSATGQWTLATTDNANRPDDIATVSFFVTYFVPKAADASDLYQDATAADWKSGKFHN